MLISVSMVITSGVGWERAMGVAKLCVNSNYLVDFQTFRYVPTYLGTFLYFPCPCDYDVEISDEDKKMTQ